MTINFRRLFVAALPLVFALGGCQVAAWAIAQFAPPKKVPALYEPPRKKMLVFVDDLAHPVDYEPIKRELTERLNEQVIKHNVAKEVVPYERLFDLMAADPSFNELHVPHVGQKLGADLVLYVQIERFQLKEDSDGPLYHPMLECSVKVVDCREGRLWPQDRPAGHPLKPIDIPVTENDSKTYASEVTRQMAATMADKISKLFYDYHVNAAQAESAE